MMNWGEQVMSQNVGNGIVHILSSLGFENVRANMEKDTLTVAYESNIYRWDVRGLIVIIDTIVNNVKSPVHLRIITLKNDIPVFETSLNSDDWKAFRNDSITKEQLKEKVQLTYLTESSWKSLEGIKKTNSDLFKFDLIIYPQFTFANFFFDKIYEVQFNLAPALVFSPWRGSTFTGQVIFPVYSDITYGPQSIRPGYLTLSQKFRLPGRLYTTITAGQFSRGTNDRYGIDLEIRHPFKNPHWMIDLDLALTGRSLFKSGTLYFEKEMNLAGFLRFGYFYSKFNLQFDLSVGRFIYHDYGIRFDCSRHFGETTVGFYAIYSGGEKNGGFNFTIPFPPGKRGRKLPVRILPPRYYELEYNVNGSMYQGRYFKSNPDENRSVDYFNLLYIKNSLH